MSEFFIDLWRSWNYKFDLFFGGTSFWKFSLYSDLVYTAPAPQGHEVKLNSFKTSATIPIVVMFPIVVNQWTL